MKNRMLSRQLAKAIAVGISASVALQPITVLAEDIDGENNESLQPSSDEGSVDQTVSVESDVFVAETVNETVNNLDAACDAAESNNYANTADTSEPSPVSADTNSAIREEVNNLKDEIGTTDPVQAVDTDVTSVNTNKSAIESAQESAAESVSAITDIAKDVNNQVADSVEDASSASDVANNAQTQEDVNAAQEVVEEAETKVEDAQKAVEKAQTDLAAKEKEYEAAIEAARKAREDYVSSISKANGDIKTASDNLAKAQEAAKNLEKLMSDAKDELAAAESNLKSKYENLANIKAGEAADEKQAAIEKANSVGDLTDLKNKSDAANKVPNSLLEGIENAQKEKDAAAEALTGATTEAEIAELNAVIKNADYTISECNKMLKKWRNNHPVESERADRTKENYTKAQNTYDEAVREQSAADAKAEEAKSDYANAEKNAQAALESARTAYNNLQTESGKAAVAVTTAQSKLESLNKKLDELTVEKFYNNTIFEAGISALRAQIGVVKDELVAAQEKLVSVTTKLTEAKNVLEVKQNQINAAIEAAKQKNQDNNQSDNTGRAATATETVTVTTEETTTAAAPVVVSTLSVAPKASAVDTTAIKLTVDNSTQRKADKAVLGAKKTTTKAVSEEKTTEEKAVETKAEETTETTTTTETAATETTETTTENTSVAGEETKSTEVATIAEEGTPLAATASTEQKSKLPWVAVVAVAALAGISVEEFIRRTVMNKKKR